MRVTTLLNKLLNLPGLWVRGVVFEPDRLIIRVHRSFQLLTCPECGTRARGRFEQHTRRWRHLAIWGMEVWFEGPIRRLRCPACDKVQTEAVPWARHRSWFTRQFEDTVGLLAQKLDHTAVATLTGISWGTVGSIAERLVDEHLHEDRFENLRNIGVDEISYRRHHRYLTVVIDHDRGRVIWAGEGKSAATLASFFELLGPQRAANIERISIDMSAGYIKAVKEALAEVEIVFDRFHVARLANDAVDQVRRAQMRQLDPDDHHHTGCRLNEICRLSVRDVDFERRLLRVVRKGSRIDFIPINRTLLRVIEEELASRPNAESTEPLFVNQRGKRFRGIRKPLETACRKLGLPHVTHHGLRHAYATILLDEGVPIEKISKLLGHTTTKVTEQIYLHWNARHLRDAAERVHVTTSRTHREA